MSSIVPEDKGGIRAPARGDDAHLTRSEEEFIRRYLARPESFPAEFKRAVLQWVSLDGEPIPASQIVGGRAGVWQSYKPVWSSTGATQPDIGNGSITGRFSRATKMVTVTIFLSGGSTTVWGDAAWKFSTPVNITTTISAGSGRAYDASTGLPWLIGVTVDSTGIFPFSGAQPGAFMSSTVPIPWATSDNLILSMTYEAA